jgi:fibronectin type 3 domain-containing protein
MKTGYNYFKVSEFSLLAFIFLFCGCVLDSGGSGGGGNGVTIPANVSAVAIASDSIQVTWTGINGAERYNVFRSLSSTGTYGGLSYVTETSYVDTELEPSTIYYYRVSAVKNGEESLQSSTSSATTFTAEQVPAAPTGLNAIAISTDRIVVSWNSAQRALSYRVYRADTAGGDYTLKSTPANTSFTDTGLSAGTLYHYKVSAANSSGEGPQSPSFDAMTFTGAGGSFPAAPAGLAAQSVTASSIALGWGAVSGASNYLVYRSLDGSTSWEIKGTPSGITFTDTGLSASTAYYYKVSAVNSSGEGSSSSVLSASTSDGGGGLPPAPTGLSTIAVSTSAINLSWNAITGALSYKVYCGSSSTGSYDPVGFPGGNSYTDSGLAASTTYFYKVAAVNSTGEGPQSQHAVAITQGSGGTLPPTAPTGLKVTSPSSSGISLSWNEVSGASGGYKVYRANTSTANYVLIDPNSTTATSFTDTTITSGTSYYYKVTALNANGESPKSAAAFAFATGYNEMPYFSGKQVVYMPSEAKHYYRIAVTSGTSYTVEWQDEASHDGTTVTSRISYCRVSAWQNDGTSIFSNANTGYTNPRTFTASSTGYVTVQVVPNGSASGNYAVYYFQN